MFSSKQFPASGLELPTDHIVSLGLVINELVRNAAKQGASQISVGVVANQVGGHVLTVKDNGNGSTAAFDPVATRGLGMKVIGAAVSKLKGELRFAANPEGSGTVFSVRFLPESST